MLVYLSARDLQKGAEALNKLNSPEILKNVQLFPLPLNINSQEEITKAAQWILKNHGGIDILINNAAVAWKGDAWGEEVAKTSFATNYFGTKNMCETFAPLINENGRIVVVSSNVGKLASIKNESRRSLFEDETITPERIDQLANEFIQSVIADTYEKEGWPRSCYGLSKLMINSYVRYLSRNSSRLFKPGVKVYAVSPGFCSTSMTSYHPSARAASKGAETPVWLALQPPNTEITSHSFYQNLTVIPW